MDIKALPPELLVAIFEACVADSCTALGQLAGVCQYWHALLRSTPHLWQTIRLERPARALPALAAYTATALHKSAPLPFDVELELAGTDELEHALALLAPLLEHLPRWRRVAVHWDGETVAHTFPREMKAAAVLELTLREPIDAAELDADGPARAVRVREYYLPRFHAHPRPTDLWLCLAAPRLPRLPRGSVLPFTRLALLEDGGAPAAHPRDVLAFVHRCAGLVYLQWHAFQAEFASMDALPPVLFLPHLRTLEVAGTLAFREFVSRLHAPALEALVLQNLNVHHALPLLVAYDEDGDSDDEAADFSQSPWSDHATGMALRGLLERSRPPLRTLDMDYVDMRTKDFIWIFGRLPFLAHFRVVGSDMSDTVVAALGAPGALPVLSHLDLTGALRLSGDAIVDALANREHLAARFQYVKVSRCPGVFPEHDDALQRLFGPRFTTT
jgi:hypothetical protein